MNSKKIAAERAVASVADGMIVGLGTGSTAYWAIEAIGRRVQAGLRIQAVATSRASEEQASGLGIPLLPWSSIDRIDLTIDGADEVDGDLQLVKGGGGALLREKIVAFASERLIIIVDDTKVVTQLGQFPLPVEVVPFAWEMTNRHIQALGCRSSLRMRDNSVYVSDNGNYILDCQFEWIQHAAELHKQLNLIPGVVENGLFISLASTLIIGYEDGHCEVRQASN
ncbi:ribose-5-phosphate isomerase RpiA [Paenibacillus sp. ACRRX]|uniref:ribose-5-phosphate isomerase RpiA n=1 Tax=Paenibacillus sp. ACRRX TaxID=2918206 RepID=UPI001EF3E4CE|nr:ribose-5-phosphate isomerase RpiA [Paenibacillus sp. ACRRX]